MFDAGCKHYVLLYMNGLTIETIERGAFQRNGFENIYPKMFRNVWIRYTFNSGFIFINFIV